MPRSPARTKKKKNQTNLTSFFGKPKNGASSPPPPTKKPTSQYPLKSTQVQHRLEHGEFVPGKLVQFDGTDHTYTIQLDGQEQENCLTWTCAQMEWGVQCWETLGSRVAKEFGDDVYLGTVKDATYDDDDDDKMFRIEYDDGDAEDFNQDELKEALELYKKQQGKKKKKRKAEPEAAKQESKRGRQSNQAKSEEEEEEKEMEEEEEEEEEQSNSRRTTPRKRAPRKSYAEEADSSEEEEFEETPKPRRRGAKAATKKKAPKRNNDDEESDFGEDFVQEEESDFSDDPMIVDDDSDEDMAVVDEDSDDDILEEKPKKKRPSKASAKKRPTASKTKSSDNKKDDTAPPAADNELEANIQKNKNGFRPNNNPQKWPAHGTYVDPVGVDPTDGIVETIITAQVRKIGGLLLKATQHTKANNNPFGLSFPIKLQTACSGTDAPSIALGLIQESLHKLCGSTINHGFEYSHEMSCEIEPFKQAYIGRNFPGVPLFPDICKLTRSEQVLDVYGQPKAIPDGNLFVAGTSCKDFSMLKTTYRIDIEDKGTSGETFLAAVEFLDQKQPPVAIFENVLNAPWPKMQEYITGRFDLSQRNDKKGITNAAKAGKAELHLKFSVNAEGRYVTEEIPRQVGMRAGDVVEGFVQKGHTSNDVVPLICPEKKKTGLVTLAELAKKHKINLEADTLVMQKKARYCTHLVKVDSKEFGLPQTRQRKYLFIWRSDDPDDDLGEYFEEIMDHLKTPLLYPMEAFLLPDDHDRCRQFREALRSGRGLLVKRERAKELDFWDWELSRVKDLGCHKAFRQNCGIDDMARYTTGWQPHGILKLAPRIWPELADMWNHRRLDLIDCFSAAACRDAISRDPLHHSFTWDLSQNVTRAPFRSATTGVSGCVTPGGELLLMYKGRTLLGCEKLALQGIPHQRLDFGILSEVQQSDLAGNAMSVSVVNATMLAAICAPELRRARTENSKVKLPSFELKQKYDDSNGAVLAERGAFYNSKREPAPKTFMEVFKGVVEDLAVDAFRSSVLCTCESSGTCTDDSKILECSGCGMGVCGNCFDRYCMKPHTTEEIDVAGDEGRPDPHEFERRLRCAVPSILRLGDGGAWKEWLKDGDGLETYSFELQLVARKKRHWTLTYGAWEDSGSGRQVAEIRVDIGKIGARDPDYGLAAFVRCFAASIRNKKPLRGKLPDAARLIYKLNSSEDANPCWEFPDSPRTSTLQIVGSEPGPSQRALQGINDAAAKALKAHKVKSAFMPPVDSRNSLTHYHPLWKTFPGKIEVSGDSNNQVNGTYSRLTCEQTVVHSALWRRDGDKEQPTMYIYIRPDVLRTELDKAVFSTTPAYEDEMEVCELHDWIPENALVEKTHKTKATFLNWKSGSDNLKVEVPNPTMVMVPEAQTFHDKVCAKAAPENELSLCEVSGLSKEVIQVLLEHNKQGEEYLSLYGKSGTRNTKRLSIVAAPSLLKFAAQGKLPLELSKWYRLPTSSTYGRCRIHVPPRPVATWKVISGRKEDVHEREYDEEESVEYYQMLSNRPTAFQVKVDQKEGKVTLFMNPYVASHRAAAQLGGENRELLEIDYTLSELSSMGEPDTKVFSVPSSDTYDATVVTGLELPLYKRQAKALTRMLAIENGDVSFAEEERSEHVLPGIGWCMIGRASRKSPLRGGVLGDAIGSGKTVVTIALILAGAEKARERRNMKDARSSATLIVVPPGLVRQWDDERKKFTKNKLKCITIDSTETLKKFTVEEMCSADMVIVPAGIIEEAPKTGKQRFYTEHLSKKAGAGAIPPAPTGYSQREAPTIEGTWIRNMASGPDIYVGNNGSQRKRDAQAYYSRCYSAAVTKLREKRFGAKDKGIPIEYFTWERIVIDECHETLVTGKKFETTDVDFKEKARRGAREFLGVAQTDVKKRPLLAASGIWGLTGTPLLETEARVTELANLMGGTYLTGASHHWRKEETDSGRDLFLNQQEATRSREYRCAIQEACHSYVKEACQRNRGEKLLVKLNKETEYVNMSDAEGKSFLKEISDVQLDSFAVTPDQLGEKAANALSITASSKARHAALLQTIDAIQRDEPDTKIIVFANSSYGGHESALSALKSSGKKHCHISDDSSVQEQNEIISWFRHVDATAEDRARPRILLLSFEQAAGHNLQEACHNVIIYDPMYSGTDAVADASVEEQAVGRVMRQGQKYDVTVTRIVVKGPKGETCLDDWIVNRNLDEDVLAAATSNFD